MTEDEKATREAQYARYASQTNVMEALTLYIKQQKEEITIAEDAKNWVQSDQWRDNTIANLNRSVRDLTGKIKDNESKFNAKIDYWIQILSKHLYDDFDWEAEYRRVRDAYYDLNGKFAELEKEHRMLMKKILEGD